MKLTLRILFTCLALFQLATTLALPTWVAGHMDKSQELEKRRGGGSFGGGGRGGGGGSRGGGSSSGSRGGSSGGSRGGSSGSRGGSSGSRGAGLTSARPMSGGRFGAGAAVPFMAGAAAGAGLFATAVLVSAAAGHYPGYWGHNKNDKVYEYKYETKLNGTDYHVTCYCMNNCPCSCDKANSSDYFDHLPKNISKFEKKDNYTQVYINGTLEPADKKSSSSGSMSIQPFNTAFVVALAGSVYMLF